MISAVRFSPNRVWRVYTGGSGIDQLRGAAVQKDEHFPEDWIASTAIANNPQYDKENQGLSMVELPEGAIFFGEYLARDPENTLGTKHFQKFGANAALLMKILDAAEQLPIQCHPTVPDAQKYFHSDFGKTEAWYIIATREVNGEKPYLLLGFNKDLDVETFKKEALTGAFPTGRSMLHKVTVSPGDAVLLSGGLAHAIGCGITLIEVMEPSDLIVQPELFCGTQKLSDQERWSGAAPNDALKCFDYTAETIDGLYRNHFAKPENIDNSLQIVIPRKKAKYFEVQKLSCRTRYTLHNREKCHRAGVVTQGSLTMDDGTRQLELKCGDAFFLPYALNEVTFKGNGEIIFALPPEVE